MIDDICKGSAERGIERGVTSQLRAVLALDSPTRPQPCLLRRIPIDLPPVPFDRLHRPDPSLASQRVLLSFSLISVSPTLQEAQKMPTDR
jgi:hypothetical protein